MRPGRLAYLAAMAGLAVWAYAQAGPENAVHARRLMEAGIAHERLGRHTEAVADFTLAMASKALPRADLVRAVFDRGVALDAMGKTQAAIADYSAALQIDRNFAPALSNRANAYRRLGRLSEAKRDYLAALNCPGVLREYPYFGLGQIAERLGDGETARDYYQRAVAANPSFALAAQSLSALKPPQHPALVLKAPPVAAVHAGLVRVAAAPPDPLLRKTIIDTKHNRAASVLVQLGAFKDQEAAMAGWNKIVAASNGALDGFSPLMVTVDLPGKGRLWRLRTAVADKAAARRLCTALAARGQACVLVRD